jgi:hypothetical protein
MDSCDLDYSYLLEKFSHGQIFDRNERLKQNAIDFINSCGLEGKARVSFILIDQLVMDYFADISRLKDFHNIEKANPTKVAGYLTYWTLKRKPIQLIVEPDDDLIKQYPNINFLNEFYSLEVLLSSAFNKNVYKLMDSEQTREWNIVLENLIYTFKYRIVTPQLLELFVLGLYSNPINPKIGIGNYSEKTL